MTPPTEGGDWCDSCARPKTDCLVCAEWLADLAFSAVIVQSGLIHCGARIDSFDGEWCWLTVNVMGSHLPQRYRLAELIRFERPSELLFVHGLCASCLAFGVVDSAIRGDNVPCSTCGGSGRFGWTVERTQVDPNTVELRTTVEPDTQDGITCELCRTAVRHRLRRPVFLVPGDRLPQHPHSNDRP